MTKEELKKKICDIISPWVSAWGDDERIADALIEAGIGDVKTLQKIGAHATAMAVLQAAKAEHRAEVAERALELMAGEECTLASPEYYKEQAEKELAEESNVKN